LRFTPYQCGPGRRKFPVSLVGPAIQGRRGRNGGGPTRSAAARRSAAGPRGRAVARAALATGLALAALAALQACGPARRAAAPAAAPGGPAATAIPPALLSQARPIGTGPRFHPPAAGPVAGPCTTALGPRDGVHVEVFAAGRVLLLPAGIGARPPLGLLGGRVTSARCYGALVTLDPTGLVLARPGAGLTLGALFRSWGQPLSSARLASFSAPAGTSVAVFVNGKRWPGAPAVVPLTRHAEIVLEVGPPVPPHVSYAFPPGT
jgi:hypothetical protein